MTIALSVLPWIVYAITVSLPLDSALGTGSPVGPAALIAGLVAAAVIAGRRRRGAALDEMVIDLATAAFFVLVGGLALVVPGAAADITTYLGAGSEFWLAAVVGAGLLAGRPFTAAIARRQAPPAVHHTAGFRALNRRITGAWLVSFVVSGVVLLAAIALLGADAAYATFVVIPLSIILPVRYTDTIINAFRGASDVVAA